MTPPITCAIRSRSEKFEQLLPLIEAPAPSLVAFALDVSGIGSTSMRLSDTFDTVIGHIVRAGRIAEVRIGGSLSVPTTPLTDSLSLGRWGIQSLTVSARALCDSLNIKTGDDLVLILPNLRMLQLFVPQTMGSELMHTLLTGLLPILEALTVGGCGMLAACGCSHTVALFGAIQCAADQHPLRPLARTVLHITVPSQTSEDNVRGVVFAGLRNMSGRGLRILKLRLAGHLGDNGTDELMTALSAAANTLEELSLTGTVVLYDVLVHPGDAPCTVFQRVRILNLVSTIDSIMPLSHPVHCVDLRFPHGLHQMSIHGTPLVNADFTTMCAITTTARRSAHTLRCLELCSIKWQNHNDTLSHFGCQLTSVYRSLTSLSVTVHSVHSHHTLEFLCGGVARLWALEQLRLIFVNATVHRAVADTLKGHRGITCLKLSLLGNSHVPPEAEWPLSALARLPALSHLGLYDNRANRPTNRSVLHALDATARARESLHYHREGLAAVGDNVPL